ncbi:multifunctional transcriptional regulator/nicotinamide-nucleotide adenylyltransferase/ribosylnicotinamide kinase NadR [Thorsellia anophelis]|uniref:HTH-type transcriptional regulator, transcriptional repressor of NAD biosynthesis genes n=1 Tax=Thorsellia anophelis DSM 18579 TaxID=1123402 RepID=A0A1I0DE96_9GAMM|nr:multifunctional transcriptional regulator/nicotinamide-nucleotide adenylyltransferase/ribosylnicotinamide kinase NadR [Thorsellia anophelis]SET30685.1 HTH-type transcriptional regulator, transcriptional repressor of NAD biosynthesis genes [Thorsellia anophelis DSM 18579]
MKFLYLKQAIKAKGYTLQKVASACGISKGYLSQLINGKVEEPSAQKLQNLHKFLKIDFPKHKQNEGVIFGKFYPLHTGHVYLIQRAASQVDKLHIILCHDEPRDKKLFDESKMSKQPTVSDRLRWLLQTFKYQQNIKIHLFNEIGIEPYPNGWQGWSEKVKEFLNEQAIIPDFIYSSERGDAQKYKELFNAQTHLIDPDRQFMPISGERIRLNPFKYWEYIPTEVKPFFVRTVAVIGAEQTGKSTLVNKLANTFNTTSAWQYYKEYLFSNLGNDEKALQHSDYDKIALGHAQYIDFAVKYANRVAFIDTDFVTLQAQCKKHIGKEHSFIQAMLEKYRFDLVLLIGNEQTKEKDKKQPVRTDTQKMITDILNRNGIEFVNVGLYDHDHRYLTCVEHINKLLDLDS